MKIEIFIEIINKFSLYLQKIILSIENTEKYRKIGINNLIPVVVPVKP